MSEIIINTKYKREVFTEMYLKDRGNILTFPELKTYNYILLGLLFAIITLSVLCYYNYIYWLLIALPSALFLLILPNWLTSFKELYNWRKQVFAFIDERMRKQISRISLTENTISFQEDDYIKIVTWQDIKSVDISALSIAFTYTEETNYVLRNSISIAEYETIMGFVNRKIKNVS